MEMKFLRPVKKGTVTARAEVTNQKDEWLQGKATLFDEAERPVVDFLSTFKVARDSRIRSVYFYHPQGQRLDIPIKAEIAAMKDWLVEIRRDRRHDGTEVIEMTSKQALPVIPFVLLWILTGGCTHFGHYPVNEPLNKYEPGYGYIGQNVVSPDNSEELLLILPSPGEAQGRPPSPMACSKNLGLRRSPWRAGSGVS
jgi:hypothetical protein